MSAQGVGSGGGLASPLPAAGLLRLWWSLVVLDARRGASWWTLFGAALGCVCLAEVTPSLLLPLAWAHGVLTGVAAVGALPVPLARGRRLQAQERLVTVWAVQRACWPLVGLSLGWWLCGGDALGEAWAVSIGGVFAAVGLLSGCRRVGCSPADAASGTLGVTVVATLALFGFPQQLRHVDLHVGPLLALWAAVAGGLLAGAAHVDHRHRLDRELTVSSGPLGHSELRRWLFRLLMAGALFGMVRWLFSTEPQVALYGLVGGLLVAGFLLPEVLGSAAGPSADFWGHVAWREGAHRSPWRRWQPWLVAAVIPVWPLLIAVVLVPAVRGREALAAVAAIAAVVAAGMLAQFAVRRRLLASDSACALALLTLWLCVLAGLPWCRSTLA